MLRLPYPLQLDLVKYDNAITILVLLIILICPGTTNFLLSKFVNINRFILQNWE